MNALSFTQNGNLYEATFSTAGACTLHIEYDSIAHTRLYSTTEQYANPQQVWDSHDPIIDQDFLPVAEATTKYYKVVSTAMPTVAKWV